MRQHLALLLLVACSDYELALEQYGTLEVQPGSVEVEGACSFEERTVTLSSVGEYALRVSSITLEGEGWVLLEAPDTCLLYTSPSPRDLSTSRMPSSA